MKLRFFSLLLLSSLAVRAEVTLVSGTVYDVGKGYHSFDGSIPASSKNIDSNMCWAAASANLIQYWQDTYGAAAGAPDGYTETSYSYPSGTCYLEVYDLFRTSFKNDGGSLYNAANWYFNGVKCNQATASAPGYYKGKGVKVYYKDGLKATPTGTSALDVLHGELEKPFTVAGVGVLLNIKGKNSSGSIVNHAITCWGYETDANNKLIGLFLSDSDDLKSGVFRVTLEERGGQAYFSTGYSDGTYGDLGDYYIDGVSYLEYCGSVNAPVRNTLAEGVTEIGVVTFMPELYTTGEGLTVKAGGILASTGTGGTFMTMKASPAAQSGNGLEVEAGALMSLTFTEVDVSGFAGNGIEVGAEAYFIRGSMNLAGNGGFGLKIAGTEEDPKCFVEMAGNSKISFIGNNKGGLFVGGGRLYPSGSQNEYHEADGEAMIGSNEMVVFSKNSGAGAYVSGSLRMESNKSVEFTENKGGGLTIAAEKDSKTYYSGVGSLNRNESLVFKDNEAGAIRVNGILAITGNTEVSISGNTAGTGAAVYSAILPVPSDVSGRYFMPDASLELSGNGRVFISGNRASSKNSDIIFNQTPRMSISHNTEVVISGNTVGPENGTGYVIHNAGGAIKIDEKSYLGSKITPVLEIAHNGSFTFSGNTNAQYDIYNEGKVYLCADEGQTITFQYGIHNAPVDQLNKDIKAFIGVDSENTQGGGCYVFANGDAAVSMSTTLATVSAGGGLELSGSTKSFVVSKAELEETAFTLKSASLSLSDVTLSGSLSVDFGCFADKNSLVMTNVSLAGTGTQLDLTLDLAGGGEETRINLVDYLGNGTQLSIESVTLTLENVLDTFDTLVVDTNGLIDVSKIQAPKYNLQQQDGTVLYFESLAGPGHLEWSNASGSGVWKVDQDKNWTERERYFAFQNDVKVDFKDKGAGTVTLEGTLSPSVVVVESSEAYVFTGSGSLSGDMTLAKKGTGSLTIQTDNRYSGDTTVEEGVLKAGHVNAFGAGAVILAGGKLDLGGLAVRNDITAAMGTISAASAYAGNLTINGEVSLDGVTKAKRLTLECGILTGGSISGTAIISLAGTISSTISGTSSVTSSGAVTLSGTNTYTGTTKVTDGVLTAGNVSAFGKGAVILEGGKLDLGGLAVGNAVSASKGTVSAASAYAGNLTINGEVSLDGVTKAKRLTLEGGILSGGSISDTAIISLAGTISSTISGSCSVTNGGPETGSATVVLSGVNDYNGGTKVATGTMKAGNDRAFGNGGIELCPDATLDLNNFVVCNDITAAGGTLNGAGSYAGTLTVCGDVTLGGTTKAQAVVLQEGSLEGGSIRTSSITAANGTIYSDIAYCGSLAVSGDVTLAGDAAFASVTVGQGANLSTTVESVFTTEGEVSILGGLSISGTWVCGVDSTLTVVGEDASLVFGESAVLDFSDFAVSDSPYTIASAGQAGAIDLASLTLARAKGKKFELEMVGSDLLLHVSDRNPALAWKGGSGVWQNGGATQWDIVDASSDSPCFHNGDDVVFGTKATVTITGDVDPGEMTVNVQGKDAVTFSARAGAGAIVGGGSLTMDGTGTLKMNAANFYTGGTIINAGTVTATGDTSFGTGVIKLNAGTLDLGGKAVANDITAKDGILNGAGKYMGSLTVTGTLEVKSTAQAKGLTISGGTLTGGTIKDTAITLDGGTLASTVSGISSLTVTKNSVVTGALSQTGGTMLENGAVLTFGQAGVKSNMTVAAKGSITGDGSVTMVGAGTLKLSEANTYTGGTAVKAGTVAATGDTSFGTGGILLEGGTLDLGGKAVANAISAKGGTLSGAGKYTGSLMVDGAVEVKSTAQAKDLTISGGTLSGGTIKDTAIILQGGTLASAVSGTSTLTVTGTATLTGKLSHTGGTVFKNGGKLTSNLTLAAKQTLTIEGTGNTLNGDLALTGGSIVLTNGAELAIKGTLNATKVSTLDASALTGGETATITFASASKDWRNYIILGESQTERKMYTMDLSDKENKISVSAEVDVSTALEWAGGNGKWEVKGSQGWNLQADAQAVSDTRFYGGDSVSFNNSTTKAITVTLVGDLAPESVVVTGTGAVTFSGKGGIVGDTSLVKEGDGTLKLNATNTYTGGTVVKAGTVAATGETSFGSGDITLEGGTLDLGGKAVVNAIYAYEGTITNATKFAGQLCVYNDVTVNGTLAARELYVEGTLAGGTIKDTAISLAGGSISSAISGKSSLTVCGDASLTGKLSYTGGTFIEYGTLTADLTLAAKQTLSVSQGTVDGKVTMSGGSIVLTNGSELNITGELAVSKASTLDVLAMSADSSATITCGSISGNWEKNLTLGMVQGERKTYDLKVQGKQLTVTVTGENTDLTWQGAKGNWELLGNQKWDGESSDNRFYHGDNVTFSTTAAVTLKGRLAPGSVTVAGAGNVTFSGSGDITGGTDLVMNGSGTLKMNATNTYTGMTEIRSGTVVATGVDSFGLGSILLDGGTLDLGGKAVKNYIMVNGTASIRNGKSFAGAVYVSPYGTLSLRDGAAANLTGTLVLAGGKLDLSGLTTKQLTSLQFGTVETVAMTTTTINVGDLGLGTYTIMNVKDSSRLDTDLLEAAGLNGVFSMNGTKLMLTVSAPEENATASLAYGLDTESALQAPEEAVAAVPLEEPADDAPATVTAMPDTEENAAEAPAEGIAAAAIDPRQSVQELIAGTLYTTQMSAQIDGNRAAMDSLRQLMGYGQPASADGKYRFAVQATGADSHIKGDGTGVGYRRNGFGGLLMVEEMFNDKTVAGVSLGYEHAYIRPDGFAKYESDDTRVNVHLLWADGKWQSRGILGVGIHDYDFGGVSAASTGHSVNFMEELARTIELGDKKSAEPFLRIQSSYNHIGTQQDGTYLIGKQEAWATNITLGTRYVQEFSLGGAVQASTFMLEAGVTKAIGDEACAIDAALAADPAVRGTLAPVDRKRWSADLGGSVNIPVGKDSAINAGATLRLYGGTTEVNANVGYSHKF